MDSAQLEKVNKAFEFVKGELAAQNISASKLKLTGSISLINYSNPENSKEFEKANYTTIDNEASFKDFSTEEAANLGTISMKLTDDNYEELQTEVNLKPNIHVGDRYVEVKANDINTNQEKILLKENGVTVIDFWAEWCGPCISAMKHNFEMIEKNFNHWKDKVAFYTATSSDKETAENFIKEKGWNKFPEIINHYLIDENNNTYSQTYGVEYIPFILIVDQKNVLRHVGSIGETNIEEIINKILAGDEYKEEKKTFSSGVDTVFSEKFEKFEKEFYAIYPTFQDYYKKASISRKISFKYDIEKNAVVDIKNTSLSFSISLRKEDYNKINTLLNEFFTIEEITNHKLKVDLLETFDLEIPENFQCHQCQKNIERGQEIAYTCKDCKIFFCFTCVNSIKKNEGKDALVHKEHYLIAFKSINQQNSKCIETYKLGKNLFAKKDNYEKMHNFSCNGCGNNDFMERYICLTCRPGAMQRGGFCDICESCFSKIYNNSDHYECMDKNHLVDHIYLNLLYSGNNYYDY